MLHNLTSPTAKEVLVGNILTRGKSDPSDRNRNNGLNYYKRSISDLTYKNNNVNIHSTILSKKISNEENISLEINENESFESIEQLNDDNINDTNQIDKKSLILDIQTFCTYVQKQQPPLIRLETLSPLAVHRLIWTSYFIFFCCILLAAIHLPKNIQTYVINGICGPPENPIECNSTNSNINFMSRIKLPSTTEYIQIYLTGIKNISHEKHNLLNINTSSFSILYDIEIREKTEENNNVYIVKKNNETIYLNCIQNENNNIISSSNTSSLINESNINIICEQKTISPSKLVFNLNYFAIQLEAQYNLLALASAKTDSFIYMNFKEKNPFEIFDSYTFKLVATSNYYILTPIISMALALITITNIFIWFHTFYHYTPRRHLPQRSWITLALISLLVYNNPVYCVWDIISFYYKNKPLTQMIHFIFQTGSLLGYMLFMLWMLMMSTGMAATSPLPTSFYLPKIIFTLLYLYVYFVFGYTFAFQPSATNIKSLKGLWLFVLVGFQCFFYIYIILRSFRMWNLLHRLPYYRTRFQQLSFRVFMLQVSLLLLSMILQFIILIIGYAYGGSLTNQNLKSFSFLGRKIFIHMIVYVMTYCYMEPLNEKKDEPGRLHYVEGQYVVQEKDLHFRPIQAASTGIITQVSDQAYDFLHAVTSNIAAIGNAVRHIVQKSVDKPNNDIPNESDIHITTITGSNTAETIDSNITNMNKRKDHTIQEKELTSKMGLPEVNQGMVFCVETAVLMMNMAITAYYDPPSYSSPTLSSFGFQGREIPSIEEQGYISSVFICNPVTDTVAMIVIGKDRIIISFRGTGSMKNIKTDLRANQVPYRFTNKKKEYYDKWNTKPRVHSGFWNAYESIRDELIEKLRLELISRISLSVHIYVTGHSLGGALATLASIDIYDSLQIYEKYHSQVILYNFGCPRVGNHAFANYFNNRVINAFRIACDGDVVTGIPKHDFSRLGRDFFGTYKHVGVEIVIDPNGLGNMIVHPNFVEKKFNLRFRGSGSAHYLKSYRKGFRGLVEMAHPRADHI